MVCHHFHLIGPHNQKTGWETVPPSLRAGQNGQQMEENYNFKSLPVTLRATLGENKERKTKMDSVFFHKDQD